MFAADPADDDILLKHGAVRERDVARIEDMDLLQADTIQQEPAEAAEVRPVREAPRDDRDDLALVVEQLSSERDKPGVQVGDFNPGRCQCSPFA